MEFKVKKAQEDKRRSFFKNVIYQANKITAVCTSDRQLNTDDKSTRRPKTSSQYQHSGS
jgi:hypothetical protein